MLTDWNELWEAEMEAAIAGYLLVYPPAVLRAARLVAMGVLA